MTICVALEFRILEKLEKGSCHHSAVEFGELFFEVAEVAVVFDGDVGGGAAGGAVGLGGEAGVGFRLVEAAGDGAAEAELFGRLDRDHEIEVGGVAGLDQQRCLEDGDALGFPGERGEALADERMDRGLEPVEALGVGEDQARDRRPCRPRRRARWTRARTARATAAVPGSPGR